MNGLSITLADVGEGLAEAEIVGWLVAEGDTVTADQPIVEIETDKAVIELPAPVDGIIASLTVAVGEVVPVGALLAVMTPSESAAPNSSNGPPDRQSSGRVLASPANRRRALESGIDLTNVRGSGPGGRITADDLDAVVQGSAVKGHAASVPAPVAARTPSEHQRSPTPETPGWSGSAVDDGPDTVERPLGVRRRAVAETMTRSWREIPHITELREIDATALVDVRSRLAARLENDGVRLTVTPLLALATIAALRRHPDMHSTLDLEGGRALQHRRCNLGLAVATDAGLVVPVVADAHRMGLRRLAETIEELGVAARENRLRPEQVRGGTFTISNFGSLGVWLGTPIIRPPEVAIAGFGRIREQVVAVDGEAVVRPVLPWRCRPTTEWSMVTAWRGS